MSGEKWLYNNVKKYIEIDIKEEYTLLSTEYEGIHKQLKIKCKNGHEFNMSFGNIKDHEGRCPECNLKNKNKENYAILKESMANEGCFLISTLEEYKVKKTKLIAKCKNGHTFNTSWDRWFNSNDRCCECVKIKKTKKKILDFITPYKFSVVKWLDGFKNADSRFIVKCNNGHEFETCLGNLKASHCGCGECFGNIRHNGQGVYDAFISIGLVPKFNPSEYKSANQRLPYICPKHLDDGIMYKEYSSVLKSIKNNKMGCAICTRKVASDASRMDEHYVLKFMINKGMIPLEGEKYINSQTHIQYICEKHKDKGIQKIAWEHVKEGKGCKYCAYDSIRGKNHYNYKGGITPIYNRVRDYVMKGNWRKESYAKYGGKCVLTNTYGELNVHHLNKSFSDILSEAMDTLNLMDKNIIKDCTEDELVQLEELVLKLHYNYGYGIPLNKNLHNLFHVVYGKINNTPKQFEEFSNDFYKGIYDDDLIEEKLKSYNVIKKLKEVS
jgi:hypothetical protein